MPQKRFDWPVLRDNVLAEVGRLEGAYTDTLTAHDVTIFKERAELAGPNSVKLASGKAITANKILIATGARPLMPDLPGIEHAISSNETFHLDKLPKRILIAGGGYIANEFAGVFHQFGSHVTLVNRTDILLRGYDQQIVDRLLQIAIRKGIDFKFHATIEELTKREDGSLHVRMSGCDDIDCWAVCTPLCLPERTCDQTAPRCDDGTCSALETPRICSMDCAIATPRCGDFICNVPETATTCPGDCP